MNDRLRAPLEEHAPLPPWLVGWTIVAAEKGLDALGFPAVQLVLQQGQERMTVRFTADGYSVMDLLVAQVETV